ncbi:hypothetical protein [Actinoplanes friuliensis]|jgi:hypothetical protein|uniref:hypothetical protein n=1 Tax=Actinoplanes friuliensis TaxID=196914 RepID=UPI00041AE4CD|nr:hypothetical protein [Actinoplanes friuliensis]
MSQLADAALVATGLITMLACVYLWSKDDLRRRRAAHVLRLLLRPGSSITAPDKEN